ncbi:MAG: Smr/MutS family protein [Polyangiaceae bacterium]
MKAKKGHAGDKPHKPKGKAKKEAAPEAPPPKLYRPFEKLAKDAKKQKAKPASDAAAAPKSTPRGAPASAPSKGAPASQPSSSAASSANARAATKGAKGTVAYASAAAKEARALAEGAHSAEDAQTFALYMSGVRALDDKATRIPRSANRLERAAKGSLPPVDVDAPARAELQALVAEGIRFETSDDGERIEGRRIEVEPREVRRLRRGQYTVDQQIDLHGLTAFEARKQMEAFLEKRRKEGDRVLRIIHGKGGHSPRGVSVLRGEIAAWLSQGPAKRHIAAFATAPDGEGGAGALLVLLMRPRA